MGNNGHDVAQPAQPQPTEMQGLFVEAMFWKQKYFELLQHSNQVIAMLSRPPAGPEQLAGMLGPEQPEAAGNVAQQDAQRPARTKRVAHSE